MTVTSQTGIVTHKTMRDEIDRLKVFFQVGQEDRDLDHVVRAFEDLPEDAREQALMVLDVPDADSFGKKVVDVTTDVATDLYGALERVKYLHFLSLYPVLSYIYEMSSSLSRGSRPSTARLAALARGGDRATGNLGADMEDGDAPEIQGRGLAN